MTRAAPPRHHAGGLLPLPRVRVLGVALAMALGSAGALHAQESVLRGRLHIVWDGDARGANTAEHYLVEASGRATRLVPKALAGGELLALDRRTLEVGVAPAAAAAPGGAPEALLLTTRTLNDVAQAGSGASTDAYDFVTVLCRFADDESTPFTTSEVERVHDAAYPGVRHFYAELSWNDAIMAGSRVSDWYTLPRTRAGYVSGSATDVGALARDCTSAAQNDIDFSAFYGINLQFSGALGTRSVAPYDTLSFGGSWTLTLNGVTRSWGVTWLSGGHVANRVVVTHEMGHALGWPHSSGEYGDEYDSRWDVMSRGYLRWEPPHGWLSVHTIAHHKDMLGWVPEDRRWVPRWGVQESAVLTRTALPTEDGYLLAHVPLSQSSAYTVEARRLAGHDRPLPAEAVVLHRITNGRAYVVDVDGNGNPNDAGAQWRPGQTYQDSIAGFTLSVDSLAAAGFHVTITRGWRLALSVSGSGTIAGGISTGPGSTSSGIVCSDECVSVLAERGARVTLSAQPDPGWVFAHWMDACSGADDCAMLVEGQRSVRAVFERTSAFATTLSPALMGAEYRDSVAVDLVAVAATWSVIEGSLPAGLDIDPGTGAIHGIPRVAGAFHFSVQARTGTSEAQQQVRLEVNRPVLTLEDVIEQLLGTGSFTPAEVRFLDLQGNANGVLDVADVRRWLLDAKHLTESEQSAARAALRVDTLR